MNDWYDDAEHIDSRLPFTREQLNGKLSEHVVALDQVTEPRLVYWDLWDGNILVQDDQITGLIDAERALWGDPLMEYYFHGGAQSSDAYYESYGYRFDRVEEVTRRQLYDLHIAMIQVIEYKYRGFSEEHEAHMRNYLVLLWNEFALAD